MAGETHRTEQDGSSICCILCVPWAHRTVSYPFLQENKGMGDDLGGS